MRIDEIFARVRTRVGTDEGPDLTVAIPGIGDVLDVDPLHHGTDGFFAAALERVE